VCEDDLKVQKTGRDVGVAVLERVVTWCLIVGFFPLPTSPRQA
jgi:hypothetical protein